MKVAIYARVSTEKQEKQETIESQLTALRDYAKQNNLIVCGEYKDDGYSGELLDRPALDRLRDDAKKKIFEAVLVHSPDRLARKYIYSGLIQEELKKNEVSTVFLNRPDSKDTPEDNLLSGVQGLIAEYEKAKIIERTRRGRLHKARSGILISSIAPYGYRYVNKDKHNFGRYEMVESEAKTVKLVFDLLVNKKLSVRSIIRELTRRGIQPRQGKKWATSSLHRIVRNETYAGLTYYNKHILTEARTANSNKYRRKKKTSMHWRPKEQWIPIKLPDNLRIISKETFDLAQEQLRVNANLSPRNVKNRYLLRGFLECGECASPFHGEPCHGKLYYRCGNRHRTFPLPRECRASSLKGENIERVVWDAFCNAISNPRLIIEQAERVKDQAAKSKDTIKVNIEGVENELKILGLKENRLLDAYREEVISIEQLKEQMVKIQEKRSQLTKNKEDLLDEQNNAIPVLSAGQVIKDYCSQIKNRLKSLENDFDGKRYLLSLAVKRVTIKDRKVTLKGYIPLRPIPDNTAFCHIASQSSC